MKKTRKYTQKLFLTYSFVCLGVLLLFFLAALSLFYRQQYIRNTENQSQLAAKTSEQTDVSLQSMDRIVNGLLFNKNFIELMKDPNAKLHYTDSSKQILNAFTALDAPLFPTHRIIAFDHSLYYNLSKTGENQAYLKYAITNWPWERQLLEMDGQKLILPPHQDSFENGKCSVYSVARAVTDGDIYYGIIEVQNRYEDLEKLCALDSHLGAITVLSPQGKLIYPASAKDRQQDFYLRLFDALPSKEVSETGSLSGQFRFEGNQVCYTVSGYSGWITLLHCPVSQIVPYTMPWLLAILLIFALVAVNFAFVIRIVTDRMTAPLLHLNNALKEVSLDNLSLELPQEYGIEEIEDINQSFLTMFEHLRKSIAHNVQARANEERANFLALQSQMNPHTIYNTIGMIESVSYMNGDKEVSRLCVCFSHMLRYISDYSRKEYTVRDELEHLENYSTLIRTRYDSSLKIIIRAAPGLLSLRIPKFTLQPLAENCVKHGFSNTVPQLVMEVDIQPDEDGWYIQVKDNGSGFSRESLLEVRSQLAHCDECLSAHEDVLNMQIGNLTLSNIYIRCRIMFGPALSFTVDNNNNSSGCFIRLKIADPNLRSVPFCAQNITTTEGGDL